MGYDVMEVCGIRFRYVFDIFCIHFGYASRFVVQVESASTVVRISCTLNKTKETETYDLLAQVVNQIGEPNVEEFKHFCACVRISPTTHTFPILEVNAIISAYLCVTCDGMMLI